MDRELNKMSVKEFRDLGYLQELNRRFLHPLGLALEVEILSEEEERFGGVWDYREDPEGIIYNSNTIDAEKAQRIESERLKKEVERLARLGYGIQPTE